MEHFTINDWYKTYLIGAMSETEAGDCGAGWRKAITEELNKRVDLNGNPIYVFDPCIQEQNKVSYDAKEYHAKMKGWIKSGNNDKVADGSRLIWNGKTFIEVDEEKKVKLLHLPGDYNYVENSDFLICKIEPEDKPCGTYFEAGYAMKLGIPIYVIQTMPREKYRESFVGWVFGSGGGFFDNPTQLLEYIDKEYDLKIKKERKTNV